ncbi:MAG: hypothetical protein QXU32_01455 [Nitrososphaerales archaeon]
MTGESPLVISEQKVVPFHVLHDCTSYWSGRPWSPDQASEADVFVVSSDTTDTGPGVVVRAASDSRTYYRLTVRENSIGLSAFVNGTYTQRKIISYTLNPNTWYRLRMEIKGQDSNIVIRIYVDGNLVDTHNEQAIIINSGAPGITYSGAATGAQIDNWVGYIPDEDRWLTGFKTAPSSFDLTIANTRAFTANITALSSFNLDTTNTRSFSSFKTAPSSFDLAIINTRTFTSFKIAPSSFNLATTNTRSFAANITAFSSFVREQTVTKVFDGEVPGGDISGAFTLNITNDRMYVGYKHTFSEFTRGQIVNQSFTGFKTVSSDFLRNQIVDQLFTSRLNAFSEFTRGQVVNQSFTGFKTASSDFLRNQTIDQLFTARLNAFSEFTRGQTVNQSFTGFKITSSDFLRNQIVDQSFIARSNAFSGFTRGQVVNQSFIGHKHIYSNYHLSILADKIFSFFEDGGSLWHDSGWLEGGYKKPRSGKSQTYTYVIGDNPPYYTDGALEGGKRRTV